MTLQTGNTTTVYNISYDNDGRINQVTTSENKRIWGYTNQGVVFSVFDNNDKLLSRSTIVLNGKGYPETFTHDYYNPDQTLNFTNLEAFEYNNEDQLVTWISKHGTNPETTKIITWSEGNMVLFTDGTDTTEVEYYTDQPVQAGDYLQMITSLSDGMPYINNKNLPKSIDNGYAITNFNYEYDQEGKITKFTLTESSVPDVLEISYQYTCE
jgi:hypothetical protein